MTAYSARILFDDVDYRTRSAATWLVETVEVLGPCAKFNMLFSANRHDMADHIDAWLDQPHETELEREAAEWWAKQIDRDGSLFDFLDRAEEGGDWRTKRPWKELTPEEQMESRLEFDRSDIFWRLESIGLDWLGWVLEDDLVVIVTTPLADLKAVDPEWVGRFQKWLAGVVKTDVLLVRVDDETTNGPSLAARMCPAPRYPA